MGKVVVVFDLDGVLATRDIAFDLFKQKGWEERFNTASHSIADAVNAGMDWKGRKPYAGMTLEVVMNQALKEGLHITERDVQQLAIDSKLMRGAARLMQTLRRSPHVQDIFIVSTTYKPAAEVIGARLGIPKKNVYATQLSVQNGRVVGVIGEAVGGENKAHAVVDILKRTKLQPHNVVAVGDSITDIGMMEFITKRGGLSIAFNANKDLLMRNPRVIYAGRSLKPVDGLVKAFALKGHEGVQFVVRRNALLRRNVPSIMDAMARPNLFTKRTEKADVKSATYRAKTRSAKYSRLR